MVVIGYSTSGGKWAVMAVDFLQGLIMVSVTLLVCFLALREVGGISVYFGHFSDPGIARDFQFVKEPDQFDTGRFSLKWIIAIFFMQIWSQIGLATGSRFLAVKDGTEARKASLLALALMAVGTAVWFIPPMVARFLYEDAVLAQPIDNPSNSSYAFLARQLLPEGLMGVMIAAMFAATISSMDTGLNGVVGLIIRKMIPRARGIMGKPVEMRAGVEMFLCRAFTVVIGLVIVGYAMLFAAQKEIILFDAYLFMGSIIGIPVAFPLVMGMLVRKLPRRSCFLIAVGCLAPSLYSIYDQHIHGNAWTIQDLNGPTA